MIEFLGRAGDGQRFILAINGRRRSYEHDKAGRRQAILDGLAGVEPVTVGPEVYLSSDAALQVVATVLYPDGIHTETAYRLVTEVTAKACAHLGYDEEVALGPPQVPFAARGAYWKKRPPLDPRLVLDELDRASISRYEPRREASRDSIGNKAAWETYGQPLTALTETQQAQIWAQVDAIASDAGWEPAGDGIDAYVRPLPVNAAAARQRLEQYLESAGGRPVSARNIAAHAQAGAFGRAFYTEELAPELAAVLAEVLQAHGYQGEPEAGEYRPVALEVGQNAAHAVAEALARLRPAATDLGPALLLDDILAAVRPFLEVEAVGEWQLEQLLRSGEIGRALRKLGFRTELVWCRPYQFRPPREDQGAQQVLLKEVRVQHDPDRKLALASGLAVHAPAVAIDDEANTLVYLEMVGPKQSVQANWAALVGGGKVHWIGSRRVQLDGMKEHVRLQTALPCGWADAVLIHKQASLKEMNPEQPFYLLDDGARTIPPLFYAMLNKALALPLLEGWAAYLWESGRAHKLITLLNEGLGQGYAAWRVLPAAEAWQQVVAEGLSASQIRF